MEPIVQVSLDLMTIAEAMPVAETAVRAGVEGGRLAQQQLERVGEHQQ